MKPKKAKIPTKTF